jgi:hypothetical protein
LIDLITYSHIEFFPIHYLLKLMYVEIVLVTIILIYLSKEIH